MKKVILLYFAVCFPLLAIGQAIFDSQEKQLQTEIANISNQKIISDQKIVAQTIYLSDLTIDNNTTVYISAVDSVVIGDGFTTEIGANVTIEAVSSNNDPVEDINTSIEKPEFESTIKSIKVHTITGQMVYSSETNTDIYSTGLSQGIYIIQTEHDNGNIIKEKVMLRE